MSETKHADLTVEYWHTVARLAIWDGDTPIVTIVPAGHDRARQQAIADRIIRAVNAHDELLAACKAARALFLPRGGLPIKVEAEFRRMVAKSPELAQINAAIAKAERGA